VEKLGAEEFSPVEKGSAVRDQVVEIITAIYAPYSGMFI
jgi:hypothetical protein